MYPLWFPKIGKGKDVACIIKPPSTIGYPYLDTCDLYRRADVGERPHRFIVVRAEVFGEEEVPRGIVVRCRQLERLRMCATSAGDPSALATLLTDEEIHWELPHLELGMKPEERPTPVHQRVARSHRDIPHFDETDDIVLFTLKGELESLGIGLEGCPCVVVHPKAQLRP